MKKSKTIHSYDENQNWHGYQELYHDDSLWHRGSYKHGRVIGYQESNLSYQDTVGRFKASSIGEKGTIVKYYIK